MYLIDQQVANQIAQTVPLQAMHTWFRVREEEIEEMEATFIDQITRETGTSIIGVAVTAILPILVESEAITKYISETGDNSLRTDVPEILTIQEAGLMAEREFTMTAKQAKKVEKKLSELWSQMLLSEKLKI